MAACKPLTQLIAAIDDLHTAASEAALDYRFYPSKANAATTANAGRLIACVLEVGDCVQAVSRHLLDEPNGRHARKFAGAMRRLEGLYRMHQQTFADPTVY